MSNTVTREQGNFSLIPNDLLNDPSISLTAKGLYAFMRGKPPAWNFTIRSMAKQLKEGETALGAALNDLKESGWLSYEKLSNGKGIYHLFWNRNDPHDDCEPKPEKPNQGFPKKGKPQRISNKEPVVTKIDNKDIVGKPDTASKVIEYLNQRTGSKFRPVKSNLSLINARFNEGHSLDDVIAVIDRKCAEWSNDSKMRQYLRPSTLFNAEKFNTYVGQIGSPTPCSRGAGEHASRHIGFDKKDYTNGLVEQEDGTYVF